MSSGFLTPDARLRVFSDLGLVLPGGKLYTYVSGTPSTPLATYSDSTLLITNANPVVASAGGLFGPIYLTKGVAYKLVLTDSSDVQVWSQDPVTTPTDNSLSAGSGITLSTVAGVTTIAATSGSIGVNNFRLSLTTAVPVTTSDVTAATTLYAVPYNGNRIDLYDAAGVPSTITSAQFSIAVPATTSQMYDVFCYSNSGVPTLELLAWTNDTTRATALVRTTTGTYTKTGDLTRRYLGSFRTTTVSGQTEDSVTKRYLWNYYNRVPRSLQRFETTASWTYASATIRQANGAVGNQVELVSGDPEAVLDLMLSGVMVLNSGPPTYAAYGIGEDTLVAYTQFSVGIASSATVQTPAQPVRLVKNPAVGRHVYSWNESAQASGTTTFFAATNGGALGAPQVGLSGVFEG